ncbi:MAG: helix-turn-helix domain-containing protein [Defluviitaleaceae bacterium]|nr:helix-turn-helix domain-containing protein [Defluviitaleaceae bacterium]
MARSRMKNDVRRLNQIIGANIKRERMARGLSRDELAKSIVLTTPHLGLIERGERGANMYVLEQISTLLKITIDKLFVEPDLETKKEKTKEDVYRAKAAVLLSKLELKELKVAIQTMKALANLDAE